VCISLHPLPLIYMCFCQNLPYYAYPATYSNCRNSELLFMKFCIDSFTNTC
jgi:hypothetical protein